MPTPVKTAPKPLTSWSFSRYSDYKQCPARFKYKHLEKRPEPKAEALQRGADIHDAISAYLKGESKTVPKEAASYAVELKALRTLYLKPKDQTVVVEDDWAFTSRWGETQWNNWAECWVRIKLDAAHTEGTSVMIVRDWKTGKLRDELVDDYLEQLELYALAALLKYIFIVEVRPELCYVDLGVTYPETPLSYTRADIPRLIKLWEKRVAPMFKDKKFAPRPNSKCRWCHFRRENGGPCQY